MSWKCSCARRSSVSLSHQGAVRHLPEAFASGLHEPPATRCHSDARPSRAAPERVRKGSRVGCRISPSLPREPGRQPAPGIESGLAEGMYWYGKGELQKARNIFGGLANPETKMTPELRRRARYWFALTLFRMGLLDDGRREAVAYWEEYGEDPSSIEIQYRYGEAPLAKDPDSARAVFEEIVAKDPENSCGREAGARREELGTWSWDASCSAP